MADGGLGAATQTQFKFQNYKDVQRRDVILQRPMGGVWRVTQIRGLFETNRGRSSRGQ